MKMGECGEGEKEEWEGKGKEREGRRIIRKQSGEGQRVRQREGKKVGQEQTEWRDGQRESVWERDGPIANYQRICTSPPA